MILTILLIVSTLQKPNISRVSETILEYKLKLFLKKVASKFDILIIYTVLCYINKSDNNKNETIMNINFEHFETKPVKLNTVGQFLQHCYEKVNSGNLTNAFLDVRAYINFLDTHLQLGHFVPTDSEGNVLEEPKAFEAVCKNWEAYHPSVTRGCIAYQAAKDAVLFEGWEYVQTGSTFYIQNKNWGIDWYGEKGSIRLFVRTAKSFGKQSNNIIETINDLAEATKDNPIKLKTK